MPVIQTSTVYVEGAKFKRRVSVLASGMFHITLPPSVTEKLGMVLSYVKASTLDRCERLWQDAVDAVKAARTTKTKVILYRPSFQGILLDEKGDIEREFDDISFAHGYVIGIEVGVYIRSVRKLADVSIRKKSETVSYSFQESTIPRAAVGGKFSSDLKGKGGRTVELVWTQKREEFFVGIVEGMAGMMRQLLEFSKPRKLALLSSKGRSRKLLQEEHDIKLV